MRRTSDPHSSSSSFPRKTFQIRKDLQDSYQYQVQYTLENISETLYQAFSAVQFTLIPQTFQISTYQKPENCSNKIVFEIQGIEQTHHPSVIISASKEPSKRLFTKKKKKKKIQPTSNCARKYGMISILFLFYSNTYDDSYHSFAYWTAYQIILQARRRWREIKNKNKTKFCQYHLMTKSAIT